MDQQTTATPELWGEDEWLRLFRSIIKYSVQPSENIDDILAGGFALGRRRAELQGRSFEHWQDVPHVLSIFCWWKLKPVLHQGSREFLLEYRWQLFAGAGSYKIVIDRIKESVPDEILKLRTDELFDLLQIKPIQEIISIGEMAG